jgi:hypothetical protein
MKTISVLKPTDEVLNKIENYFESHGYRNISVNYKANTLRAERQKLFSRRRYVDVNISSPKPIISVIEMKVHSRRDHDYEYEANEEQLLHDSIYNLF